MEPLVILDLTPEPELWVNTINSSSPRSTTAFVKKVAWFGGVVGDTLKDAGECGAPMTGIALCLSPGRGTLEVRNIAVKDVVLNLGTMEANGMRQYPTAITLLLKDGTRRRAPS